MANESGPEAGVEGVVEDMKGRAKEAAGAGGNESLTQEGQAQQDKAAAPRYAAAKEAEAEKARAEGDSGRGRAAVASGFLREAPGDPVADREPLATQCDLNERLVML